MSVSDQLPRHNEVAQPAFHSPALASEAAHMLSSSPARTGDSGAIASAAPTHGTAAGSDAAGQPHPVAAKGAEAVTATAGRPAAAPSDAAGQPHPVAGKPAEAASGKPADVPAPAGTPGPTNLATATDRIEAALKKNPNMEGLSGVYKELDNLRQTDGKKFGQDLDAINKKLHADGLLPGLSIVQDRYTGTDGKEHAGFSMIANDPNNPHNRVGTEVSNNHTAAKQTPESSRFYHQMEQHQRQREHAQDHGHHGHHRRHRHHHFDPTRDSAESGRASHGGYDRHLVGGTVPKGERKELIDKALEKAGIPQTPQYEAAMNKIITRESGWNPNIVNNWDSNARRGDPSKGLMQVIHSTFEQYRDKSLPNSQTDPLANTVAALNYMGHRYGHGNAAAGLLRVASRSGGY